MNNRNLFLTVLEAGGLRSGLRQVGGTTTVPVTGKSRGWGFLSRGWRRVLVCIYMGSQWPPQLRCGLTKLSFSHVCSVKVLSCSRGHVSLSGERGSGRCLILFLCLGQSSLYTRRGPGEMAAAPRGQHAATGSAQGPGKVLVLHQGILSFFLRKGDEILVLLFLFNRFYYFFRKYSDFLENECLARVLCHCRKPAPPPVCPSPSSHLPCSQCWLADWYQNRERPLKLLYLGPVTFNIFIGHLN